MPISYKNYTLKGKIQLNLWKLNDCLTVSVCPSNMNSDPVNFHIITISHHFVSLSTILLCLLAHTLHVIYL